jgi:FlaA1/EpsC-like NDP-sugar epimerase
MKQIVPIIKALPKHIKVVLVATTDFILAFALWYGLSFSGQGIKIFVVSIGTTSGEFLEPSSLLSFYVAYLLTFIYLLFTGFYRSTIASYESKLTLLRSVFGSLIFGISYTGCFYYIDGYNELPFFIYFIIALGNFIILYAILNIVRDLASYILYTKLQNEDSKNILIYGAGAAGLQLLNTIKDDINLNIVGLFDDANNISGSEIHGYRVYGKKSHLKQLKESFPDLTVYLAIPSLDSNYRHKIISKLEKLRIAVKTMPGLHQLVSDDKKLAEIQDLSLDDILPRDPAYNKKFDFKGKSILITGAGGSIGSEIARQALDGFPNNIVLFDISEFNLYKIHQELENIISTNKYQTTLTPVLGDIKDEKRIKETIIKHKINCIYHSAAYKHVPIIEYHENVFEGILNNIFGTKSVCQAASETGVSNFVLISTDKAVRPTNVMGATKRLAELVAQSYDYENESTKFCMVRFGNVINSSGSVIPLFTQQIKDGGPITITHKDVTRFFMTIPEAANLVMQAGEFSKGGEVFILNMGEQIKIYDLALRLIHLSGRNVAMNENENGIRIQEIGLRPGEKLYEELLISGDEDITNNEKIFVSKENFLHKVELERKLNSLKEAFIASDVEKAIDVLKETVEGYN